MTPLLDFFISLYMVFALAFAPVCPVDGPIVFSDDYGLYAKGRVHRGVDVFAERGTPVVTPEAGVVTVGHGRKGGTVAWLDAIDGTRYYFAHLDSHAEWVDGLFVKIGQRIGSVGNTGNAKCCDPHLHLGMQEEGRRVSPYPQLVESCR